MEPDIDCGLPLEPFIRNHPAKAFAGAILHWSHA